MAKSMVGCISMVGCAGVVEGCPVCAAELDRGGSDESFWRCVSKGEVFIGLFAFYPPLLLDCALGVAVCDGGVGDDVCGG
jgi:hypothetical protein